MRWLNVWPSSLMSAGAPSHDLLADGKCSFPLLLVSGGPDKVFAIIHFHQSRYEKRGPCNLAEISCSSRHKSRVKA